MTPDHWMNLSEKMKDYHPPGLISEQTSIFIFEYGNSLIQTIFDLQVCDRVIHQDTFGWLILFI